MKGKAGFWVPHLGAAFSGILDTYPNAGIALGVRRLRDAYSGSCMRVVRASDGAEQDIGFVSNEINTAAIASFCSGTTGYVGIWYDQSGSGYNAKGRDYGVNLDSLPIIYESSAVVTMNGKPAVKITHPRVFFWNEASAPLSDLCTGGASGSDKKVTAHVVGYQNSSSSSPRKIIIDGSSQSLWFYENTNERTEFVGTAASSGTNFTDDTQKAWCWQVNGNTFEWFENGGSLATSSNASAQTPSNTGLDITIGGQGFSTRNMEGFIQEVIIWKTAESASGIYTNANDFFGF